mgnify:CR=1 FL=1
MKQYTESRICVSLIVQKKVGNVNTVGFCSPTQFTVSAVSTVHSTETADFCGKYSLSREFTFSGAVVGNITVTTFERFKGYCGNIPYFAIYAT